MLAVKGRRRDKDRVYAFWLRWQENVIAQNGYVVYDDTVIFSRCREVAAFLCHFLTVLIYRH